MNGSISDGEPFGATTPGITPSVTANNNPEWATSDAFSSAFDAFSSNKMENVSINDFVHFTSVFLTTFPK